MPGGVPYGFHERARSEQTAKGAAAHEGCGLGPAAPALAQTLRGVLASMRLRPTTQIQSCAVGHALAHEARLAAPLALGGRTGLSARLAATRRKRGERLATF